jgi:leucyl aminopeptidase
MLDQTINCIVASPDGTRPIHVVRPDGLPAFFDTLPSSQAAFLRDTGFAFLARMVLMARF